jgi:hypothetical protein
MQGRSPENTRIIHEKTQNILHGRLEEFKKRLRNFIEKTRENKMIGFGGIEKYY